MKIVAEHWWLKPRAFPTIAIDATTNYEYADYSMQCEDVLAVGTQKQLDDYLQERMDNDNWEIKDAWEYPIDDELKEMYKKNNNQIIILNLKRWQTIK